MPGYRILLVDDVLLHRTVMLRLLQPYGACDQAHDGAEAFQMFKKAHTDKKPYQLVCMDIIMPNIDGNEALLMIREEEKRLQIPFDHHVKILMTTSQNDSKSVMEAMRGQCDGYLLKPVQRSTLESKLKLLGFEPAPPPKPPAATKTEKPPADPTPAKEKAASEPPAPKSPAPEPPAASKKPPSDKPKPTSTPSLQAGLAPE